MNLATTITITVYFLGLVNFSPGKKADGTPDNATREVVAPLANTATPRTVGTDHVTLQPHRADIVISGVPAAQCSSFPDSKCEIREAKGMFITLPAGTASLDTSAHNVPSLTDLCRGGGITGIKDEYLNDPKMYAVRLTLTSGKLSTCANGMSWASCLVLTAPVNSELKVEDEITNTTRKLTLSSDTIIYIDNHPPMPPPMSGKEHFWWHYAIAKDAENCTELPKAGPPPTPRCLLPRRFAHLGGPAATGLGCSNSQYP